eukprot:scaffold82047_cov31-Tisochrysis_lutea.AAC.6
MAVRVRAPQCGAQPYGFLQGSLLLWGATPRAPGAYPWSLSFFASRVSLELGASSSLSMLSKSGRKSLVSIRFLGCLPMSAWALLDESVEL